MIILVWGMIYRKKSCKTVYRPQTSVHSQKDKLPLSDFRLAILTELFILLRLHKFGHINQRSVPDVFFILFEIEH